MDADELNEPAMPYTARPEAAIPPEWLAEFEAAARRPLETRFRYAFIRTYKLVLDDAPSEPLTLLPTIGAGARRTCRTGWVAFEYRQAQEIRDCFQQHGIRYLSSENPAPFCSAFQTRHKTLTFSSRRRRKTATRS